ncbi:hypothetical protein DHEL01_v208447 [Diaporthe helianthi]|uniref:Uncharacterized protein n=1 Tax=Diaporthe helianthi TaxID=158607 RepID=A0A2P5HSB9_DIAHE|nr:hypothetical protein DHEL01_v208447 [Diaporthe helianthi]
MSRQGLGAKTARAARAACRTQSSASSTSCGVSAVDTCERRQHLIDVFAASVLEFQRRKCENQEYEQGGWESSQARSGWIPGSQIFGWWTRIKLASNDDFSLKAATVGQRALSAVEFM